MPKQSLTCPKTALAMGADPPWWPSSRSIRDGIIRAYHEILRHPTELKFSDQESDLALALARIRRERIARLIFVESAPHPLPLVQRLCETKSPVRVMVFHVYGNFTNYLPEWNAAFRLLARTELRVRVIAASEAERGQLKALLHAKDHPLLEVVAFPLVSTSHARQGNRKAARASFGIRQVELALTYAGRISLMKNVDVLIRFFGRFLERNPQYRDHAQLLIAGDFDDVGSNFLHLRMGEYFSLWQAWYKGLPSWLKARIRFLGALDSARTQELLLGSDIFVSLSTFHDEDFGMAPREALAQGTPAVLTRWGGYADLDKRPGVELLPVSLTARGLALDEGSFERALHALLLSQPKREDVRRACLADFSIKNIAREYERVLSRPGFPIHGPSPALSEYARLHLKWRQGQGILYPGMNLKDRRYRKIYEPYFRFSEAGKRRTPVPRKRH